MSTRNTNRSFQSQGNKSDNASSGIRSANASVEQDSTEVAKVVREAMQAQQQLMMQQLTSFIQTQLSVVQVRNSSSNESSERTENQASPVAPAIAQIAGQSSIASRDSHNTGIRGRIPPEKVGNIIQGWRVKFEGSKEGILTEEFLYRIRALTKQNLQGDYSMLCDHLHLLFGGKASDWYWKFHQANPSFTWELFCTEFRKRFEDIDTDMDIWELINSRRQGEKELFEEYQFAVEKLQQAADCAATNSWQSIIEGAKTQEGATRGAIGHRLWVATRFL
ncbi:hypothetical protein ACLKA6_004524 [Drosophila palustris]